MVGIIINEGSFAQNTASPAKYDLLTCPAGLSSDLYPPRSIEGKSRTKLCQKRPQVPGLGHLQSYARFKGGKTKQGYQRMVGWCRLMVMADG